MNTISDFTELLNIAVNTAVDAAKIFKNNKSQYQHVEHDLSRDVKVLADKKLEAEIISQLSETSPYPVLSEESGIHEGKETNSEYRWIVDPLDGSLNFSRGIPINCISIAFWKGFEPVLGVIYDFNRNEIFSGIVGEGAWLNEKPIAVSNINETSKAVLCTGFPVSTDFSESSLLNFCHKIKDYKKVRLLGSAALSLAYVACGRADTYMENHIKLWDVAAGIAIVSGAGGKVDYAATDKENVLIVKADNQIL